MSILAKLTAKSSQFIPSVSPINVCVFGGGSFGTAMAVIAARNGHKVKIFVRRQMIADLINNEHKSHIFPDTELPSSISATTNADVALDDCKLIIHCIPTQASYDYLVDLKSKIPSNVHFLSTSKGIYMKTSQLMCQVLNEILPSDIKTGFLSGPSFAKELMAGLPTAVVIASSDSNHEYANYIAHVLSTPYFRVYTASDVVGVELGGALKNPLAIGAGIMESIGMGSNTFAGFLTRGCAEMRKLSVAMGADPKTFNGLSGIGDLMLTAYGGLSRNRTVGIRLGKGEKLDDIIKSLGQVAEGVSTSPVVIDLANKYNIEMPIFRAIDKFIRSEATPEECLELIMNRPLKDED